MMPILRTFRHQLFSSLSIPAYRWLWLNAITGSVRLITIFVARGWLVLTLTDSPFWVGAAPAMRGLTQILIGSFVGVMLDRVNRKTALLISETGSSLSAFAIGALVLTGQIELWHVFVASVVEGLFISIRWPAINTMIVDVVDKDQVLNASAAQMLGFNVGNVGASFMAGAIVATFGVEYGYFFAGAFGLVAALCVLFVKGDFRPKTTLTTPIIQSLHEGITYIRSSRTLTWLILLGFLMSLLGWSNLTMFPVMARDVLGQEANGFGTLTGFGAIGSLISTAAIAGLGDYKNKMRLVLTAGAATAIGILAFSLSRSFELSLLLAALMQGALMAFEVSLTASVLLMTADKMQGRVQGIYTQVFGFTWVGGVVLGGIAEFTGVSIAIAIGGLTIGLVLALLRRPLLALG
ncbi:MAG: MFS transporter [Candidatus Promineifilaceae bacterium]